MMMMMMMMMMMVMMVMMVIALQAPSMALSLTLSLTRLIYPIQEKNIKTGQLIKRTRNSIRQNRHAIHKTPLTAQLLEDLASHVKVMAGILLVAR
jgi:hypothetical protein